MKKHAHNGMGLAAAALLVGALGLGNSASAQAAGAVIMPMHGATAPLTVRRMTPGITVKKHLSCKVWGTPVEFPHSVLLTNDGMVTIAAGSRVHYVTKGGNRHGDYTFTKALAHGASIYAPLSGDWARGAPCTVRFEAPLPHAQRPAVGHITGPITRPIVALPPLHALCRTGGDGEFVNKAELTNDSVRTIPAGTRIHYAVNDKVQGDYTFTAPLNRNQHVVFKLSLYTAVGLPCSVTFLK